MEAKFAKCILRTGLDGASQPRKQTHFHLASMHWCCMYNCTLLLHNLKRFLRLKAAAQIIRHPIQPNSNGTFERFQPVCLLSSSSRHVFESQSSLIDQDSRVVPVYCMSAWLLHSNTPPPLCSLHSQPARRKSSQPDPAQGHLQVWQLQRLIEWVAIMVPAGTR